MRPGSKAQTLEALRPLLRSASLPDQMIVSVEAWRLEPDSVLESIADRFATEPLAVRSSAAQEDTGTASLAGHFTSVLDVKADDADALSQALRAVQSSYDGDSGDEILVQPMVRDIAISGVITTHVLDSGAPYFVLNYDDESGKTDTITGGTGVNKTVLIHRDTPAALIESGRVSRWLALARELESIFEMPLDIEFAETRSGELFLLQSRPIAVVRSWNRDVTARVARCQQYVEAYVSEMSQRRPGLLGDRTIFGEMPDWNPAEIIGSSPRPLAVSLYKWLVTDRVWAEARARMGYRAVGDESLMVMIGGRPYIDVRNSFNSMLPASLGDDVGEELVNAWLGRLDAHPELHDKIEFDVAQTVRDFTFDADLGERYGESLSAAHRRLFRTELASLTRSCIAPTPTGLSGPLATVRLLEQQQGVAVLANTSRDTVLERIFRLRQLLTQCRTLGTRPFAMIARHAFIAESLLRSAVGRGALTQQRLDDFRRSLVTVSGQMSTDHRRVYRGELPKADFLERYGHLRPGTYDILSRRYDQREDLFDECVLPEGSGSPQVFDLTPTERRDLSLLLGEAELDTVSPNELFAYANSAIVGREWSKFVFTRNLSESLEELSGIGEMLGLSRDDISHVPVDFFLDHLDAPVLEDLGPRLTALAEIGREGLAVTHCLALGYLIRDVRDVYVIPLHRGAPNFVTSRCVEGATVSLDNRTENAPNLRGKIVCIENADPGFDWIFTRGIAGLVTQFGGANSHMTIRCAEFGLPAAIGCGAQTFVRLVEAGRIVLDCGARRVRPIYAD